MLRETNPAQASDLAIFPLDNTRRHRASCCATRTPCRRLCLRLELYQDPRIYAIVSSSQGVVDGANSRFVSESEVESAPTLALEVLEGPVLPNGTTYNINCRGYVGSKRQAGDGWVFVGTQEYDEQGAPRNDIVLPAEEMGFGAVHFVIKYDSERRNYLIRDNGQGTGTFLKIDSPLVLRSGYAVGFGDSTMVVEIGTGCQLSLKFLDGPKAEESLYELAWTVAHLAATMAS
jgi:hypothetical protein